MFEGEILPELREPEVSAHVMCKNLLEAGQTSFSNSFFIISSIFFVRDIHYMHYCSFLQSFNEHMHSIMFLAFFWPFLISNSSGFDFDELLEMAKERGLSEMELNLRTVLQQQMAGKSRVVVASVVQTTKLVVGFFLQNGHKSLEEILEEFKSPTQPKPVLTDRNLAKNFTFQEVREFERLRVFIFQKVLSNNNLDTSLRTQSCIDVLMEGNLKVCDLYSIHNDASSILHIFQQVLTNKLEKIYRRSGPKQLSFEKFIEFVYEYIHSYLNNPWIISF